jgi:vacuolar-type H+-ATPase subunit H
MNERTKLFEMAREFLENSGYEVRQRKKSQELTSEYKNLDKATYEKYKVYSFESLEEEITILKNAIRALESKQTLVNNKAKEIYMTFSSIYKPSYVDVRIELEELLNLRKKLAAMDELIRIKGKQELSNKISRVIPEDFTPSFSEHSIEAGRVLTVLMKEKPKAVVKEYDFEDEEPVKELPKLEPKFSEEAEQLQKSKELRELREKLLKEAEEKARKFAEEREEELRKKLAEEYAKKEREAPVKKESVLGDLKLDKSLLSKEPIKDGSQGITKAPTRANPNDLGVEINNLGELEADDNIFGEVLYELPKEE